MMQNDLKPCPVPCNPSDEKVQIRLNGGDWQDSPTVINVGPEVVSLEIKVGKINWRTAPTTDSTDLEARLRMFIAKASPLPWGIWFEEINGKADKAIQEFVEQVHATNPIGNSLVMLSDDNGKCPVIPGCGPTSADNAALIANIVNAAPALLDTLASQRAEIDQLRDKLARAREELNALQDAERTYRQEHDLHGEGSWEANYAWDVMRRKGDAARQALKDTAP